VETATPVIPDLRLRVAAVVAIGLAVGALTSVGQTYLDGSLNAFVNSASAWLIAPLVVGSWMATRRGAVAAGLAACSLQLVGYYVTAALRGFSASQGILLFWFVCAIVGGPLFGAAGHLWRTGGPRVRGLGATALPAAFLAEGLWVYLHELHYRLTAALWIGIGLVLLLLPLRQVKERGWLALTLACALAGEIVLSLVYRQSFG